MATKRDQLQAFQFQAQRTISALVTRESDPEQPPFRRPSAAAIGSIVLSVIVLAVLGVIGIISPGGNKAWNDGKSVIVVSETGTRYVYINEHLHPVRNYTSALLAIGEPAETVNVSRNSLADVPRGSEIGIADAPDSLPDPERITTAGWTLCSRPGTDDTGADTDHSVLMAGATPGNGRLLGDQALLARSRETGAEYVLWHGYRHKLIDRNTAEVGMALRSVAKADVGDAFVDVVPEGQAIAPIGQPGIGGKSTAVPGRKDLRIGQVLRTVNSATEQYYLVGKDSLRPISKLQSDIQLAYRPTMRSYRGVAGGPYAVKLSLAEATSANRQPEPPEIPGAVPTTRPDFAGSGLDTMTVCGSFADNSSIPQLRVNPSMPPTSEMSATPRRTVHGTPMAEQVYVRPGWAALVQAMPSPQAPSGTIMLITDQGKAYPFASPEVQRILGYDEIKPLKLPAKLVARMPMGSGLDPAVARQT